MIISLGNSDIDISSVCCVGGITSGNFMTLNGNPVEGNQYKVYFDNGFFIEVFDEEHQGENYMPRADFVTLWKRVRQGPMIIHPIKKEKMKTPYRTHE
jgi:hypothetical protein